MNKSRIKWSEIHNGAELGGATGAMAPLVFWSQSLKKSRNQSLVVQSGTSCFYLRWAPLCITMGATKDWRRNSPLNNDALKKCITLFSDLEMVFRIAF